jgi:AraC-like DNA-binding protein
MTEHYPERNARIRQLRAEGWKYEAIAAEVGCSLASAWSVVNAEKRRAAQRIINHRRKEKADAA